MLLKDFRPGLYRHFKGAVYFASHVVVDEEGVVRVYYANALNVTKWYVRPIDQWDTDVSSREDNATGQTHRFERVTSMTASVNDLSTGQLLRELARREDSPLYGTDLACLSSALTCADYIVGEFQPATKDCGEGVYTIAAFDTKEEAFNSQSLAATLHAKVYRRTFIEQD